MAGLSASQDIHSSVDKAVDNILDNYCVVSSGRRALVLCDRDKEAVGRALCAELAKRHATPTLVVLMPATSLSAEVLAQFHDADQALLVLASHAMFAGGLAQFLDQTSGEPRLSVACQPVFFDAVLPLASLLRLYASSVTEDQAYLQALAQSLPAHQKVHVTAPGGTDLWLETRAWQVHAWETLTSPVEGAATGRIVADVSVFCGRTPRPIELLLEEGRLVETRCVAPLDKLLAQYQRWMGETMVAAPANAVLAEWGWGGNAQARASGIIMEDEALRDTCHFCFGDNTRYGGQNYSDWHGGTVVVARPHIISAGGVP